VTLGNRLAGLDYMEQQRTALDAEVSLPTLRRALRGDPVRPGSLYRIRRALQSRGRLDLLSPRAQEFARREQAP